MKNKLLTLLLIIASFSIVYAQDREAILQEQFGDVIAMHNVSIAFDGTYYYTVNGGNPSVGAINQYTKDGGLVAEYPIEIDMRSIMFNPKDGAFYVGSHDLNIYKIINMKKGTYRLILDDFLEYDQASPKLDPSGNYLYVLEHGSIAKYTFPDVRLVDNFNNIKSGEGNYGGDGAIAIDKKHIYTWDASNDEIYIYDLEGEYQGTAELDIDVDAGFSLCYANDMIFVAKDGNGGRGTWYGFTFKDIVVDESGKGGRKKKKNAQLSLQFDDAIPMHNFDIVFDGKHYYTINGGNSSVGAINKYTEDGTFLKQYKVSLDMRSIMYHKKDKAFYVTTYDRNIYKITDMKNDRYEVVFSRIYNYDQASGALDPKGKYMYINDAGTLKKFDFKTGTLVKTFDDIKCGTWNYGGDGAVAVTKQNIYTWNAETKMVYEYDLDGNFERQFKLDKGSCGFSLSFTNDMLFVANDGNGYIGTWFGYSMNGKKRKVKKSKKSKKSDFKIDKKSPEDSEY